MCVLALVPMHHVCSDQKKAGLPLELELQAVVSCHVGVGSEPRFSARAASALDC